MRKFAERCAAVFMALLMLLTSMPLTAIAEDVSGAWGYDATPASTGDAAPTANAPSQLEVVQAAAAENPTSGAYVSLYAARVQTAQPIATGDEFTYEIGYMLGAAPTYKDATGEPQPAYEQYEDVVITITVPDGIVLRGNNVTPDGEGKYTLSLGDFPIQGSKSQTVVVPARMTGNGAVADGTPFDKLGLDISAHVTVAGEQVDFAYALPDAINKSSVINKAGGEWDIQKTLVGEPDVKGNEVTLTWTIEIGKVDGTGITSNKSVYDTTGVLNFDSFTLTDTLPTITGKDGQTYAPKSSTLSAGGQTRATGGEDVTTLTTDYYATIDLSAGGVNTTTPYHTVYTVEATYDKAAFVLPFGDKEEVEFTNAAQMVYQLVGKASETVTADATDTEGYPTPGGAITVFEQLQLGTNGSIVDYTPFYASLFPDGATFEVYAAENWETDAPKDDAAAVETLTVTGVEGAKIDKLAPGVYYILQTDEPDGSEKLTGKDAYQQVTVTSGGNAEVTFTNPVEGKGILEIDKVNAEGDALPDDALEDVKFTLTDKAGSSKTLTLDSNGHGVIVLPVGTYTLEETTTPKGYIKMQPVEVEIEEGQTNKIHTGDNALKNYENKGTLTISKYLADGDYEGATRVAVNSKVQKDFTFEIYRATTTPVQIDDNHPYDTVTMTKGTMVKTVSGLDIVDEYGNLYYYAVVEVNGKDARFDYDDSPQTFDFGGDTTGAYVTEQSVSFTNILKSKLTFQKNEQTLLTGIKGMADVTFDIWAGVPNAEDSKKVDENVTTGTDGVATTAPLAIKDTNGNFIDYYVVETKVGEDYTLTDYTVVYPEDGDANDNAWGPIRLDFMETTDRTGTPIVNKKDETSLTVKKTDRSGTAIQNAEFTVQNIEKKYAVLGADGTTVTWQDAESKLTTKDSGQIVLSGIPAGTYIVTETGVPDAYLSTGTVTGADEGTAVTDGQALSGQVTLATLESKTITFQNDRKPVLSLTKQVDGTTSTVAGEFTFALYKANAKGTAPEGGQIGEAVTVAAGGTGVFTVDEAGTYFLKETGWPAGVIDPSLTAPQNAVVVDGFVYYGPYTLENNQTTAPTIQNTANTGSLTITKTDAKKTDATLAGATFTVSVDTKDWSDEDESNALIKALLASGFQPQSEGSTTYALTTGKTDANGQVTVDKLPLYNDTTPIVYTVAEAAAPENYIKSDEKQTATPADGENYAVSLTFENAPMAKVVVTKTWYSQWEADSGNRVDYALEGAKIAIFEEVNGALVQVGETQTTKANAPLTFEGLDGTKTYYVFELSNPKGYSAEKEGDGRVRALAGNVENIVSKTAGEAWTAYYGAKLDLSNEDDNQAEAALVNVDTYVQLRLNKWYQPEKNVGTAEKPVWEDDPDEEPRPLDRAKFHLYRCTLEAYEKAGRNLQTLVGSADGLKKYLYSDYVYESGISEAAGPGAVVTGALEGGYVYWFNEFEAPAGFIQPTWPTSLSVAFVPDKAQGNEVSYMNETSVSAGFENHPGHGGGGTIRYLQVMVDKVARYEDEKGEPQEKDLPNTTFELWLTDDTYTERIERVAKFTTGVDLPEGQDYRPGRGVSESIQMHRLRENHPQYVTYIPGTVIDGVQHGEYSAHFVLVETAWPANTTPVSYTYPLDITTNGDYDADASLATLYAYYTKPGEGSVGKEPIVNTLAQQVTVAIQKVGYSAGDADKTWPLAGAEITIYSDSACTNENEVASGTTGADGLVYFTLDPLTTYYWKETVVPNGYEAVAPSQDWFTTPDYSTGLSTEIEPIVTVQNVQYRTLQLAKQDADGHQVAATLAIYKGKSATGTAVATVETKTDGYAEVQLPAGTYTVAETKLGDRELNAAEKSNFLLLNDNETFTFGANEAVKTLEFENPGTGSLTLTKKDDADALMEGVRFTLHFKAFANATDVSATTAPAASDVEGNVESLTGVTVSDEDLTTNKKGQITLTGLVPGWYRLTEVAGNANANHVLAQPVVVKVTAANFGTPMQGDTRGSASATVVNPRKGYLNVSKKYEGMTGYETQEVTFEVYSDAACTKKAGSFTITGAGEGTAIALAPGDYWVKELGGSANWYAYYTSGGEKVWLGEDNSTPVKVTVESDNTENKPVEVSFTNAGNRATLELKKVGAQGDEKAALQGAKFALYYLNGTTKTYWTGADWSADASQAREVTSDAEGMAAFKNVRLPYVHVSGTALTYFVTETETPTGYAPAEDCEVHLVPGQPTSLTGDKAIVNEQGVVITLTKYDRPHDVPDGRGRLSGAEFKLYRMSAEGAVLETLSTQITGENGEAGTIRFDNLPQLEGGEYYAIRETVTPEGFVKGSLELYVREGDAITPDADGYYPVATNADVALDAYNTPYGRIAILKYDYINRDALPTGGRFVATNNAASDTYYNGTLRLAQSGDEATLEGGYRLDGNHYVKDGISYTVAFLEDVVPGDYTVVEESKPHGYLYTPNSKPGDPWHTTKRVTVANDGSTAVVVFANLPDPKDFTVDIKKTAKYLGEGDLQGDEYQTIEFTLSDFTQGTELPLDKATLTDDIFTFTDAKDQAVTGVEWYVESVQIGAAHYEATAYDGTPSTSTIYAHLRVKGADGAWTNKGSYALTGAQTVQLGTGIQGIEIVYSNNSDASAEKQGLDAGFTAGDVVLTVRARQPVDNAETVPVAKIGNEASISMTYDFGQIGADDDEATRTKKDSATADVEVAEEPALPKVSIKKTAQVQELNGKPVKGDTVTPGQRILYTVTLTGESKEAMENPILADTLPAGLAAVTGKAQANTTAANLTVNSVQQAGQSIWVTTAGKLAQGETLTLTILADVLPTALIGGQQLENKAYVFNNTTVPMNVDNEHGSSFTDEGGVLPTVNVPAEFATAAQGGSGMALQATATNTVASASGVTINKMVSVDNEHWVANEALLVAEKGGDVYYRVTVSNNGGTALENLRILDVLPYDGDGHSAWGPTLKGNVSTSHGNVFYSADTKRPAESDDTLNTDFAEDDSWSTSAGGAKSFAVVVDELPAYATVTITYTTRAPMAPDDNDYYQLAINTAHCMWDNGPRLSSADTKVTIMPEKVSLGDRVWIDENADGFQDANETKAPGGTTTFTLYPFMEDDPDTARSATANAQGYYEFDGLNPAAPQDDVASYSNGDVNYQSLMGGARATYQLQVSIPEGYRITPEFAHTTVEGKQGNDSDFEPMAGNRRQGQTIRFYIPAGGMDDTYDVGVIRERNLTITKWGTNGLPVAGATFAIYGPYYATLQPTISGSQLVGTVTTGADGQVTFTSNDEAYLNAYAYYVVVETSAPANYDAANLTATGDSVVSTPKPTVTGAGIENGNYFVLKPFEGADMAGAASDAVTVTNTYSATGELTITGNKTLTGETLEAEAFSFVLTSTDDADFKAQYSNGQTVKNDVNGSFAFEPITYDYADVQYLASEEAKGHGSAYHYTVVEQQGAEDGIVYDKTVYEITVTLADNDGDGQIDVNAEVNDAPQVSNVSLSFTNAAEGQLSVTKTVESNVAGDAEKEFDFTVELTNDDVEVDGTYTATLNDGTSTTVEVKNGKGSFKLTHGQTLTIGGIPNGTAYTVTEGDYSQAGFIITTSTGATGTIETGKTAAASFTNTHKVGGLTVQKTLGGNGADTTKDFTFTVTLEHETLPLNNDYGVQFKTVPNGETGYKATATFTLKGGESKILTGIPVGTDYTVTEGDYTAEGYVTTTPTNAAGTIAMNGNPKVEFVNTRNVGKLTVSKTVAGNGADANKTFDITVKLTAPAGVTLTGSYAGAAAGAINVPATATGAIWEQTFQLKNGQSVAFTGLPAGTAYTVSEEDYTEEGYVKSVGAEAGEISATADATVAYTNTRNVGSLSIEKTVTGTGAEADREFEFTLTLTHPDGVTVDDTYTTNVGTIDVANGQATFTLKGGETLTISGIPTGTTYEVTETDYTAAGYTTTWQNETGTIGNGTTATVAATNERNVGNLTVTKKTAGNGLNEPGVRTEFDVTVKLTPPAGVTLVGAVDGTALPAGGTVDANGVWSRTFTLKADETVTFTGLPEGTAYAVTEVDYKADGFVAAGVPTDGTIEVAEGAQAAPTVAVTVTNTRSVGDLTIAKTVTGSGSSANDAFTFRVELENATVNVDGEYVITYSDGTSGRLTVAKGVSANITLKGGQTVSIAGLPLGTSYTVTEYVTNAGVESAAVRGVVNENGYALTTANALTGTIDRADGAYRASFTNERKVGDLTVTKVVAGNGAGAPNALTAFDVTVTLTPPAGVTLVGAVDSTALPAGGTVDANGVWSRTFTLAAGQSVDFAGLPEGTTYEVTEADYAANGYATTYEHKSGTIEALETAAAGITATVTNTMNVGELSVTKTVTGSGAQKDRDFEFTLTLTHPDGVKIDNVYTTNMGAITVANGQATFTLRDGQTLTIEGIPEGTAYDVTEADYSAEGYTTTWQNETGTIGNGASAAAFTNTRDVGELTIDKTVTGAIGETNKAFAFTLELTAPGNGIGVDGVYDATLYTGSDAQAATVTVEDGTADFTLTHDQRLVIHEIPAGATYEVTEASYALDGYQTSASGATGTIPATGDMPVASFTNTRNAGSLRIQKVFAGNAPIAGDTFLFTIRLARNDGVNVNGTYAASLNGTATTVVFTGGTATATLTGGDTLEIFDILSGTAYEVYEDIPADSGYLGTGVNGTGNIPVDAAASVLYMNVRNTGNLIVRKQVDGNAAETDRDFSFTVFLREPDGSNANGTYAMTGAAGTSITFVNGYASLSLAAGEEAVIRGILEGAYYSVTENDANTDGYVTTSSATAGLISADADALVSFLNTRNVANDITSRTVYKVWNDENDADGLRPNSLTVYLLADGDSVAAATLNEANGWSTVFANLPVYNPDGSRINYTVVEAYTAEYYVRYQYEAAVINITNTHTPDDFTPRTPDDPNLLTLIEDNLVPLGGNINMNEGDCFN